MVKKRAPVEEEERLDYDDNQQTSCTNLDHVYAANSKPGDTCFCGKRQYKPFIKMDDYLQPGMLVRTYRGGPIYVVEMVNQSRARCRLQSLQQALSRRAEDVERGPSLLPIPFSAEWEEAIADMASDEGEEEQRGKIINISPQSAVERVTREMLEEEARGSASARTRSSDMGSTASLPIAGGSKSLKDKNKDRLAKLASKKMPPGQARPLTGAAAKAKANAKPKAQKTVRPCGCGCGDETSSYFMPGHDARFKGWIKKVGDGRLSLDELKKLMGQKTFNKYVFKKSGQGFITRTTYQEAAEA